MTTENDICNKLKSSPLFNLSLASKELFHSNFLAWLAEQHPQFFRAVFEKLGCDFFGYDTFEVKREYQNLDLCLLCDKKVFFILENKVKSLPRLDQLKEYDQKKFKQHKLLQRNKILLSLVTEFPDKEEIVKDGWKICNYKELSDKLKEFSKQNLNKTYDFELVSDYCGFIENMQSLVVDWQKPVHESDVVWGDVLYRSEEVKNLRIDDLKEKICFSFRFDELKRKLESLPEVNIATTKAVNAIFADKDYVGKVYVNQNFTQDQGLLEAKVKINEDYILLVQIQGETYLHAIEWKKDVRKKRFPEDYWDETCGQHKYIQNFLKVSELGEVDFPDVCSGEPGVPWKYQGKERWYNKYDGKSSAFLYQYSKIRKDAKASEVINAIVDDVKMLLEIQNDFRLKQ